MKRNILIFAILAATTVAPATATLLPAGGTLIPFTPFDVATQGSVLASSVVTGQALTFTGDLRTAVYRNTAGTLDFYYQFARTGEGSDPSLNDGAIETITGANFRGSTIDAMFSDADLDGSGIFTVANNPGLPATASRSPMGDVIRMEFGNNPLTGRQIGSTFVFRTTATDYLTGTFGVINGSTFSGRAYRPADIGNAVPEPKTWALMLLGFGLVGAAARRRRSVAAAC